MYKQKKISFVQLNFHSLPLHTGYFTSDNEPDEIENATHNTFPKKLDTYFNFNIQPPRSTTDYLVQLI
jgi:hypothetical protein